jgi:hypothetical protein
MCSHHERVFTSLEAQHVADEKVVTAQ